MQWSGDVDLNDGNLKKQYEKYRTRLEVAAKVGLKGGKQGALKDLEVAKSEISKDLQFVTSGSRKPVECTLSLIVLFRVVSS